MSSPDGKDVDSGHEYDGIREFDNPLPNWWLSTLYATVVFGFGYWMFYQTFGGTSLAAQLKKDEAEALMKQAASAPAGITDDLLVALSKDGATQEKAKALFVQQCAQCHNPDGSGKIGPNLTDEFWIHGGKPSEIYATITNGSLKKGMPAWGALLGGEKVRMLTSYVVTMKGTNRPGKAPEGQKAQ